MKEISVGLIGTGLMGKAHSLAYGTIAKHFWPVPAIPRLRMVADVSEALARSGAEQLGFEEWTTDWRKLITSPHIDLVDIVAPNFLHKAMAISAVRAGKHVLCEKPLALNGDEAREMYEAARENNVVTMVGFNYRKCPAVAYARHLVETGALGRILHFRGYYLQDFGMNPHVPFSWKFQADRAGSGALGGIGCHIIDTARYLVGEISEVIAVTETWVIERPVLDQRDTFNSSATTEAPMKPVDVDDSASFLARFETGTIGNFEISRCASGHKNQFAFELNGTEGSVAFDFERMNEVQVYLKGRAPGGFQRILVGPDFPNARAFWPLAGLGMGFDDTVTIEVAELLQAIVDGRPATPDFYDGYIVNLVMDAVLRSAKSKRWESVEVLNRDRN